MDLVDLVDLAMVLGSDPDRQGKVRSNPPNPRGPVTTALPLVSSPAGPLPPHLAERIVPSAASDDGSTVRPSPAGEFILYWMRTAVRGHENPALDVALHLGERWGLPVLVYHALDEGYPHASDRHHTFILEGARDVAGELSRRGVGYAFHLARPGHRGPHLLTLARRAGAVVTEEMPVPFLRRWTERARAAASGPLWTVDCDCIVPLPLTRSGSTDRAFRFRQATARLRRERIHGDWPEAPAPASGPWVPADLPFRPVELVDADFPELVASCRIDHGVAPVPHTRGGSQAGYARWQAFREKGLRSYHRHRNDPLKDGVSRLSPYLHYGHVSPFRIAREAAAMAGDGAEKFLDELLIWRELSHAFCFHRKDTDGLAALPVWARETLTRHEADPRPVIHSMETLERGRTGAELWDAAQRSLLIHGELHNNVRMTWGKALLPWSRDAGEALARLLELNDRYALDGRDPNSRGGILWCLGAFDRPFDPPRPVLGRVRGRELEAHARRLDVTAYTRRTTRPALGPAPRVAVVGAGMAGLAAARALADHGLEVRVLDKGRRPGGRMATRRSREGWMADHGAQFFTARDPRFARHLPSWVEAGVVAEWTGTVARLTRTDHGTLEMEPARESRRWIGTPGMQALPNHLAGDLNVTCRRRVVELAPDGRRWFLRIRDEGASTSASGAPDPEAEWEEGPFDAVLLTAPPPQTALLLEPVAPDLAARVARVPVAPCWAAMVEVDGRVELPFDGAFLPGPVLSWISRDSSRPGRGGGTAGRGERWVLHAGPEWSRTHLEVDPHTAGAQLVDAFMKMGRLPRARIRQVQAHRWRYALPEATDEPCLWDGASGLGVAGDAWGGPRVEGAFLSGQALAGRLLGSPPGSGDGHAPRGRDGGPAAKGRGRDPLRAQGPGAVQGSLFDGDYEG